MKYRICSTEKRRIYFSSWSRKGYAIFSALGKNVHISPLTLHMYETVLLKSSGAGVIVNEAATSEMPEEMSYKEETVHYCGPIVKGNVCPDDNGSGFSKIQKGYTL